jgi:sulfite exporter TauE/SafE
VQFLLSHCQITISTHSGVLLTLFLAGLVGGLTHCAGMCGPFVAAQVNGEPGIGRLRGAALVPYHAGRMTTYALLGIVAALLSQQIMGTPLQHGMSVLFLTLAGILFIGSALPQARRWLSAFRLKRLSRLGALLGRAARPFMGHSDMLHRYALGVLLGFLPCGLIFAALMVVATTGNPFTAALGMMVFTLGTVPALFAVGLGSRLACHAWPRAMQTVARMVMVLNGVSLFMLAGNMML